MDAILTTIFRDFVEYLAKRATPHEILAYQFPEEQQRRLDERLDLNVEGGISAVERMELVQIVYFNDVLTRLKARAQASLNRRY